MEPLQRPREHNMEKVYTTIKQLYRDWAPEVSSLCSPRGCASSHVVAKTCSEPRGEPCQRPAGHACTHFRTACFAFWLLVFSLTPAGSSRARGLLRSHFGSTSGAFSAGRKVRLRGVFQVLSLK
jgi:hypothetical protein